MTGHIIFTAVMLVLGVGGALILWKRASIPFPSDEEIEALAGKLAGVEAGQLLVLTPHEERIWRKYSSVVFLALAKRQARESMGRAFRGQSGGGRRPGVPPPPAPIREVGE